MKNVHLCRRWFWSFLEKKRKVFILKPLKPGIFFYFHPFQLIRDQSTTILGYWLVYLCVQRAKVPHCLHPLGVCLCQFKQTAERGHSAGSSPLWGWEGPQNGLRSAHSAPATILCVVTAQGTGDGMQFSRHCFPFPSLFSSGWDLEMFLLSWVALLLLSIYTSHCLTHFTLRNGNRRV